MFPKKPRYRLALADYGRLIIAGLVVVSLVGFASAGWLITNPQTQKVTETVYSDTVSFTTTDSVALENDTVLYEAGTRLRNKPVYLRTWNDEVRITIRTSFPPDRTADVTHTVTAIYRATAGGGTLYEETHRIKQTDVRVTDGSAITNLTLNVSSIQEPKRRIAREFGSVGSVSMTLRINTTYSTERYSGSTGGTLSLSVSEASFSVGSISKSKTYSDTRTRTVTQGHSPFSYLLTVGGGLLALAAAAALGFVYYREMDQGRNVDRDALRDAIQHREYAEWISEGEVSLDRETDVTVASLEDLVDVAIDADRRVFHDPAKDVYVVFDNEELYRYEPGSTEGET